MQYKGWLLLFKKVFAIMFLFIFEKFTEVYNALSTPSNSSESPPIPPFQALY